MAAKKKKSAKAGKRTAVSAPRKAKNSRGAKKAPAKRATPVRRAKAKSVSKSAPKKSARKPVVKAKAKPVVKAKAKPVVKAKPKAKPVVKAKPKAKPVVKAKAKPVVKALRAKPIQRRDGAGHLDPKYASDLRARMQPHEDVTTAFIGGSRSSDDLAEELGEEVIGTATSGEYEAEDALNQSVPEDRGGPFVPSTAGVEFASDDDESNPTDATREPFPTT